MKLTNHDNEQGKIMIIDALNLYLRAFVVNPSQNPNGTPIGGLRGFLRSLQKLFRDHQPDYCIICWDGAGGSQKRRNRVSSYKKGRKPVKMNTNIPEMSNREQEENKLWQQIRLHEYLNKTSIPQLMFDKIEADDIISYVAQNIEEEALIVSNDKDFLQLCTDRIKLYRPIDDTIYDRDKVIEEYGIHPQNLAAARAIAGDSSDNLPGINRVGLKTVAKSFEKIKDPDMLLEDIFTECKETKSKKKVYGKVLEGRDIIADNYAVMQLYSPSISPQTKGKIVHQLSNFSQSYNKMLFDAERFKDGIVDDLYELSGFLKRFSTRVLK